MAPPVQTVFRYPPEASGHSHFAIWHHGGRTVNLYRPGRTPQDVATIDPAIEHPTRADARRVASRWGQIGEVADQYWHYPRAENGPTPAGPAHLGEEQ